MLLIGGRIESRPSSGCTGSQLIAWHSSMHILVCITIVLIIARIIYVLYVLSSHIRCARSGRGKGGQVALGGRNFDSNFGNTCDCFVVLRSVC